jgi:hypothetical protein
MPDNIPSFLLINLKYTPPPQKNININNTNTNINTNINTNYNIFENTYTLGTISLSDGTFLYTKGKNIKSIYGNKIVFDTYDYTKKSFNRKEKKGTIVKGNPFLDNNGNQLYYSKNIKQLIKEGYSKEWKIVED